MSQSKCKHVLRRGAVRRPTPGERLYARLHPNRRMFFPTDIARMEELDRLISSGRMTEEGEMVGWAPASTSVELAPVN